MCGIAGFVTTSPSSGDEKVLQRMTTAIAHRGPDGYGYFTGSHPKDAGVYLGHRRLSIIDVAAGGQPMANEDDSVWIVYNGEIFNHSDMRPALEAAGHRYKTHCDTETVLHAWEEYGPNCMAGFRGMFAFALWDRKQQTLFCVRDRLGIKPFYYFWDGRTFAFASEIKALLEHPAISAQLETALLPEYLMFGYNSEERTLFRGIKRLMPGHHLTIRLGGRQPELKIAQYWDVPVADKSERRSDEEWIAETRRRLEETVRMRLMSDVPLGMFLSGGVDSSAIAALTKRLTNAPVKTFSVGYQEEQYSELSYAAEVARTIGTDHHEVVVGMEDFFNALPSLIWHEDEPITWPSSVSLHFVSKLAVQQVKVVLTGEGSDELFAGYVRYHWNQLNMRASSWYGMVPGPLRRMIRSQIATTSLLKADMRRKLEHSFVGREGSVESLFLDNFYAAFSLEQQNRLMASPADAVYGNYRRYWDARSSSGLLDRMLYADQKTYLAELLMKQDQMSMSCSIESRVPFLDHTFVEFSTRVPDSLKMRGSEQKYILKKAVEDLLPHDIIYRKKMGFPTPLKQWLLDPRAERLYSAILARDGFVAAYCDLKEIETLVNRHRSGMEDATDRLWRLLNLQLWGDVFLTGKRDRWWNGALACEATV
jgi:asparagine synthase (glutamine-hydrolysing)